MRTRTLSLALILTTAIVTGCGGGGSTYVPPTSPGGNVNEAESNDFNAQSVGTLSSTDILVAGSISNGRDVDLFRVTANGSVTMLVSLDWSAPSDLELAISNADGIFVRHVDTNGHPEACRLALPAGSYTVRVGSLTDTATGYTLTLGQR